MSSRKITSMEINGKTIWIEVDDIEITPPANPSNQPSSSQPSDLRGSAKPVGPAMDYIKDKAASLADTLEAVVATVDRGISKISPDEWSIELTIGFEKEHNIPYIMSGKVNGGITVSATWKKDSHDRS